MPTRLKFTLSRLPSLFVGNSKYWTLSIFVKTDGSPQLIGLQKKNALTDKSFQYVMTFSFTIIPFLYLNIFMPPRSYGILSLLFPSMWTALKSKHLKQSSRTFDDVSSTKLLVISYCVYTTRFSHWFTLSKYTFSSLLDDLSPMFDFFVRKLNINSCSDTEKKKNKNSPINQYEYIWETFWLSYESKIKVVLFVH